MRFWITLAATVLLSSALLAQPTTIIEYQRIMGTGTAGDRFGGPWEDAPTPFQSGTAVAVDGELAVIGAWGDDTIGDRAGAAYVFRRVGTEWVEEQKLLASDGVLLDYAGCAVAIDGDTVLVGAFGATVGTFIDAGKVYVFKFDGTEWIEEQILTASDAHTIQHFGWSLAIDGDVALIGADWDNEIGPYAGAAYIYNYDGSTWVEQQKLLPSIGEANDVFAYAVAIEGDTAILTSPYDDHSGFVNAGTIFHFEFDGASWNETQTLTASTAEAEGRYGVSVGLSGSRAVIGTHVGTAYTLLRTGGFWDEEQLLTASDDTLFNSFGEAVSMFDETILVGRRRSPEAGTNTGSAYVYELESGGWVETRKLMASEPQAGTHLGACVSTDGATFLVSSPYDPVGGAAYLYDGKKFLRGDANADSAVDLSDVVFILAAGFVIGSPQPGCTATADANGDGAYEAVADAVYLIFATFVMGSPPPPFPFPDCGMGAASDYDLGCDVVSCP